MAIIELDIDFIRTQFSEAYFCSHLEGITDPIGRPRLALGGPDFDLRPEAAQSFYLGGQLFGFAGFIGNQGIPAPGGRNRRARVRTL